MTGFKLFLWTVPWRKLCFKMYPSASILSQKLVQSLWTNDKTPFPPHLLQRVSALSVCSSCVCLLQLTWESRLWAGAQQILSSCQTHGGKERDAVNGWSSLFSHCVMIPEASLFGESKEPLIYSNSSTTTRLFFFPRVFEQMPLFSGEDASNSTNKIQRNSGMLAGNVGCWQRLFKLASKPRISQTSCNPFYWGGRETAWVFCQLQSWDKRNRVNQYRGVCEDDTWSSTTNPSRFLFTDRYLQVNREQGLPEA